MKGRAGTHFSGLNRSQAAQELGVSERTVGRLIDSGALLAYRPSPRRIVIPAVEITRYRRRSLASRSPQ